MIWRRLASVLTALGLVAAGLVLALNGASLGTPAGFDGPARPGSFKVTAGMKPTTVLRNERVVVSGTVRPVRTAKKVLIQLQGDGSWSTVGQASLNHDGVYRYAFKAATSGDQVYRVRMPRVGAVKPGTSPEQTLSVAEEALVVFKIKAGTSAGDWNTQAQTVQARVGDTLRIINDDLMTHRPHTVGDPFPNPSASESLDPGKSRDYVLDTAYASSPGHTLYCAIHGQSSHFWLDVVEP